MVSPADLPDWLAAYGGSDLPAAIASAVLDLEASLGFEPDPPYLRFVAYRAGRPLATASLFLAAGAAGLYNVFTLPEARGEGLGRALTSAGAARSAGARLHPRSARRLPAGPQALPLAGLPQALPVRPLRAGLREHDSPG